jgi:hypothetical protein
MTPRSPGALASGSSHQAGRRPRQDEDGAADDDRAAAGTEEVEEASGLLALAAASGELDGRRPILAIVADPGLPESAG